MNEHVLELCSVISHHKPILTDELKTRLVDLAEMHLERSRLGTIDQELIQVSPCILISLMHEIIRYRDRYGFIELPEE